ncbi:hypothetical protein ACKWTF_003956 [Chironomus riparius]
MVLQVILTKLMVCHIKNWQHKSKDFITFFFSSLYFLFPLGDSFELPEKYEQVENVRFNGCIKNGMLNIFVITCRNGIIFGQWDPKQMKLLRHLPARSISITFTFVDTIFIENTNRAISITKCGSAIVWSNSIVMEIESFDMHHKCGIESYKREFIKSIKLCETPLTVIKSVDDCVVIADANGKIRFYDKELKIIFWCPSHDFIDTVITISFDKSSLKRSADDDTQNQHKVRDFLIQTQNEIYAVNFTKMKFTKVFFKSDDYITAMDVFPLNKKLICCANYSGRIVLYDYDKKVQIIENQLKLRKRKSSMSDMDVIEIPHISTLAYSRNGHHLMCGLENGTVLCLDPDVLHEMRSFNVMQSEIAQIKFSPDSFFVAIYDVKGNMIVMYHDKATEEEWLIVGGKIHYHTQPICDILYIPQSTTKKAATTTSSSSSCFHQHSIQTVPRLISLAHDRQIVEYDLLESMKENSRNLVITFTKRIYQTAIPTSMTLIYNSRKHEDQILIADTQMKFRVFDKNTFEILATFMGPIYDSYVKQFDANTSYGLTDYSKFFIFTTNKNLCLYAMPMDGNPYRSLGVIGHADGIRAIKADSTRHILFTIGHKCQSLFMWHINFQTLFDHVDEGGSGLKPYCDLLPGGKYGNFFQDMQDLYYYMLMLTNGDSLNDRIVKDGLDINEIGDYFRGLGYYPSDYEIECINHELHLNGKRKIGFEELMKLFINHAPIMTHRFINQNLMEVEKALREFCNCSYDIPSEDVLITKANLIQILTETAEKVDLKDAHLYVEKLFQGLDKTTDEISLWDFLNNAFINSQ